MLSTNNQTNNIHSYKGKQSCVLKKNEKLSKPIFFASIIA